MARFGTWKPLAGNWASQSRMTQVDIISLHTMVGSLAGTDGMWRKTGYAGNHSHFGIGGDGTCWQWQDTAYRAAANYNGNWHIISVECADVGAPFPAWNTSDGNAVPAFSAPQIESLAQLVAAMCLAHNIPCVLIPDAKPGRRGVGYHRLGVPGYMVAGAEQWSTARGKVCPGNRRIAQIPQVIARAQQILNGTGGFLMALSDAQQNEIYAWLRGSGPKDTLTTLYDQNIDLPRRTWWEVMVSRGDGDYPVIQELADAKTQAVAAAGQVAGFQAALSAVASDKGVDIDAIKAAVDAAVRESITNIDVTVNTKAGQ